MSYGVRYGQNQPAPPYYQPTPFYQQASSQPANNQHANPTTSYSPYSSLTPQSASGYSNQTHTSQPASAYPNQTNVPQRYGSGEQKQNGGLPDGTRGPVNGQGSSGEGRSVDATNLGNLANASILESIRQQSSRQESSYGQSNPQKPQERWPSERQVDHQGQSWNQAAPTSPFQNTAYNTSPYAAPEPSRPVYAPQPGRSSPAAYDYSKPAQTNVRHHKTPSNGQRQSQVPPTRPTPAETHRPRVQPLNPPHAHRSPSQVSSQDATQSAHPQRFPSPQLPLPMPSKAPPTSPTTNPSPISVGGSTFNGMQKSNSPPQNASQVSRAAQLPQEPIDRPQTVDLSKVFDHEQHRKRQLAEQEKRKQSSASEQSNNGNSQAPEAGGHQGQGKGATQGSSSMDQMETDLKQMLELMRVYKSKDPATFNQVWEKVKKGQIPPSTSSSTSTNPPAVPSSPVIPQTVPSPTATQVNPENESSSFPPGFDRGRFPYQRRRRGGSFKPSESRTGHLTKSQTNPGLETSLTVTSPSAASAIKNNTGPMQATEERLVSAMKAFHSQNERGYQMQPVHVGGPVGQQKSQALPGQTCPGHRVAEQSNVEAGKIGNTPWPEDKKAQLAEAASRILNTHFSRDSRIIMASEVHQILDQDASYGQICEYLEGKGFMIDRAKFARMLLHQVPSLEPRVDATKSVVNQTQPPPPSSKPLGVSAHAGPVVGARTSIPQGNNFTFVQQYQGLRAKFPSSNPSAPGAIAPNATSSTPQQTPSIVPVSTVGTGMREPTQESEAGTPTAQSLSKQDKARKRNFSEIIDLDLESSDDKDDRHSPMPRTDKSGFAGGFRAPGASSIGHGDSSLQSAQTEPARTEIVAQPMDKRRDALRRSSYDPRTICRDVLVSSGRHPSMAPLNYHLDILRDRFQSVDYDTDLSTLRWDILDPDPPELLEQPAEKDERLEKVSVARNSRIDRAAFAPKVSVQVGKTSRKRDQELRGASQDRPPLPGSKVDRGDLARSPSSVASSAAAQSARIRSFALKSEDSDQQPIPESVSPEPTKTTPQPKRRGRPPGAKNQFPRSDKGIPKKAMPEGASGFAVVVSRSPSVVISKDILDGRSGRPSFAFAPPAKSPFEALKCHWEQCPAELHDLDTLRKHIRKHRTRLEKPYVCRWEGCGSESTRARDANVRGDRDEGRLRFNDMESWDQHMDTFHVSEYRRR